MSLLSTNETKLLLDLLYVKYNTILSSEDPIWYLHNLKSELEIETAGFIISAFTYGNIKSVNKFIKDLMRKLGYSVHHFIGNFNKKRDSKYLKGLKYRFADDEDIIFLICMLNRILRKHGSIGNIFKLYYDFSGSDMVETLKLFTNHFTDRNGYSSHLVPDAAKNSTCKRLNLFLRWMVRKDNVDLGIWEKRIDKASLLIPVDIHVYKVSRMLNLIKRKTLDMRFVRELTDKLKFFDPNDPVKYDFSLCHIGVEKKPLNQRLQGF